MRTLVVPLGVLALVVSYLLAATPFYRRLERKYQVLSSPLPALANQRGPWPLAPGPRAKAAIVMLARNSDVDDVIHTLRTFEPTFNGRYRYPYVFLNDKPWSLAFRARITASLAKIRGAEPGALPPDVRFGLIPTEHWSYPPHVDQAKAKRCMQEMQRAGVPYAAKESYHHMCRFQSGFFFEHELLAEFDWYWRLEPDVDYFCPLHYDPFQLLASRNASYGFNILVPEFMDTIPSLSATLKSYMSAHNIPAPPPTLQLMWDNQTDTYNGLHFWSNFEIASLRWLRSPEYATFFEFLDQTGNFYYERWGDAPVHSVAAGMLLKPSELHYFEDIGYRHGDRVHCPAVKEKKGVYGPCGCDLEEIRSRWVWWGKWAYKDRWRNELERWRAWAAVWQKPEQ
ncbi:putative alpha-1,2-mannosyltransferase [Geranomyces variabilis]|nr:putative alpha-1,2-mannosyltransferase [Geranomyces variabilis]KAJ3135084.1 alpha 1,2-mannosyltransferase 2.4.1 [Geranomyces variabilis]